jgi:hypothetical protein
MVVSGGLARRRIWIIPVMLCLVLPSLGQQNPKPFSPDQIDFFETKIRPLLQSRCLMCHSSEKRTNGLSLESRESVLAGGNRGPAVEPGKPDSSRLVQAVQYSSDLKMPPTGKLNAEEISLLRHWVEIGLPWTELKSSRSRQRGDAKHWAFEPVHRFPEPQVRDSAWVRNPIDSFVLARLEKEGLRPAPEADRVTLIRRLSLDLLGLPPEPAEVDAFLSDTRPDAYECLIERLLASPHYGERWGRHWLDLARYADSNGYNIDDPRDIWMYRDWVIDAFNGDLPFDRFVIEQIAGDLLPSPTREQLVATGFHRNTLINLEGGIDFEQYRVEAVVDRVDTTGAVFLGLTLGCARCHDHKFDPISQREFYQFFAFFNNVDELSAVKGEEGRKTAHEPTLEFGTPEDYTRREAIRAQVAALEKELDEYAIEWEKTLSAESRLKLRPDVRQIVEVPPDQRNAFQVEGLKGLLKEVDIGYRERLDGIQALKKVAPKIPSTMVMRELPKPRESYVYVKGDFLRKGIRVYPSTPAVLPPLQSAEHPNRLDLARWLVDPMNPLTPRVTVNRIWQRYFGKGFVETDNDFGTQGSPPSHPELLDWLASEFMVRGWSQKAIHRLIATSATYRQSSRYRPDLATIDPGNRLLARQSRLRLEAEIIRDGALGSSGLFNAQIGGPSVFPPQPEGASKLGQIQREWVASTGPDRYRRGMYTFFWRSSPHPGLMVFDAPDSTTTCTRRLRSNTPLQALTLLNDQAFYESAQEMALRVLREAQPNDSARVAYAFRLCLGRQPQASEQARLENYLITQLQGFRNGSEEARLIFQRQLPPGGDMNQCAAWTAVSRVLLNLDEFVTRE